MAKLGIADLLKDGARSSEELAAATETCSRPLYRVLRALASVGVLTESPDHRFALTAVGSVLRRDVPDSLRGWVLFTGEPWYLRAWEEVLHSMRTDEPAWDRAHGMPFFEYLSRQPAASAIFDEAMTNLTQWDAAVVPTAYDFSPFRTLVDVGGGQGAVPAGGTIAASPRSRPPASSFTDRWRPPHRPVLNYVGRYTDRIALSNNRLVDITDDQVRFRRKDYRQEHHPRR